MQENAILSAFSCFFKYLLSVLCFCDNNLPKHYHKCVVRN